MFRLHADRLLTLLALVIVAACSPSSAPSGSKPSVAPGEPDEHKATPTLSLPTTQTASRPRTREREADRRRMVDQQIAARGIKVPRVLQAMRDVPRHWFVPESQRGRAYDDGPLPIGHDQTISQPYIVALMTESLKLKPGAKVLEIGTGSGYQAAVLAELTDHVYTIEIVRPLGERAVEIFRERGYGGIQVRIGDGYRGWPEAAPFDAIIVTCAPESPPQPLIEQLAFGGRMCIPVGAGPWSQELVLLTKENDGAMKREVIAPVAFVPMTGEAKDRH